MKNIVRAFALTLVAASTIEGMEQLTNETSPKDIEKITHIKIAHIISQSEDYLSAIDTIKSKFDNDPSYEIYTNDLTKFALVAHMLAYKFDTCTTNIALRFNTRISTKYEKLGTALICATMDASNKFFKIANDEFFQHLKVLNRKKEDLDPEEHTHLINRALSEACKLVKLNKDLQEPFCKIEELIQQGADVNFSSQFYGPSLEIAIRQMNTQAVRLLLTHGAKLQPSTIGYTIGTMGWQGKANPEIQKMIHYTFINADSETQQQILKAVSKESTEVKQKFEKFIQSKI